MRAELGLVQGRTAADRAARARAKAEAASERAKKARKNDEFFLGLGKTLFNRRMNGVNGVPPKAREQLAKVLGMIGSEHEGEAINAARAAEKIRKELNLQWEDLFW
jgi:hypothetical protein